jgi:hypothetical protein
MRSLAWQRRPLLLTFSFFWCILGGEAVDAQVGSGSDYLGGSPS